MAAVIGKFGHNDRIKDKTRNSDMMDENVEEEFVQSNRFNLDLSE